MAHVQDLWEKTVDGERVRTARYGRGNRWQVRYRDPDSVERTKTFARKQDAERFLVAISADVLRGAYVDPNAGKVRFAEVAETWLAAQTFGDSSREATEIRLRLHANAHFGHREIRSIKPSMIQAWLRKLQRDLAPTYVKAVFTNVSSVFTAAVDDGLIASNPCKATSVKPPKLEKRKVEPWPVEQVEAVIDALPQRYRALGILAATRLRATSWSSPVESTSHSTGTTSTPTSGRRRSSSPASSPPGTTACTPSDTFTPRS